MSQNKRKRDARRGVDAQLPGFPGYRTRTGHTGYDPLDTNREAAFMEGTFYRKIFTLRARTHNGFYLVLMLVFGVIPFIMLLVAILTSLVGSLGSGDTIPLGNLFLPLIVTLITGAIALNFVLSILEIARIVPPLNPEKNGPVKEKKKRLPKRRKDYQ